MKAALNREKQRSELLKRLISATSKRKDNILFVLEMLLQSLFTSTAIFGIILHGVCSTLFFVNVAAMRFPASTEFVTAICMRYSTVKFFLSMVAGMMLRICRSRYYNQAK